MHYRMDGTPYSNVLDWAADFERMTREGKRHIGDTHTANGYWISTVWLGIDHNWTQDGPPLIFESMVFIEGTLDGLDQVRYSTREQATAGHARLLHRWRMKKHSRTRRDR